MDCRYCEIQVEITKRAYAARCPNPTAVLDYIKEKMKANPRPRVDLADMKRLRPQVTLEEEMTVSDQKQTKTPEAESDLLKTAAKVIGTTLGKIAVKAGIAKRPTQATTRKRVGKKKAVNKTAARNRSGDAGRAVSKRKTPKKPASGKKGK